MDIIDVQTLKDNRKQLFVVIILFTAILTPDPTPFSMLFMSIPFYILYEITILVLNKTSRKEVFDESLDKGILASRKLLENDEIQ